MTRYCLDSSIWIAYMGGNKKIRRFVENGDPITSTAAIAEVTDVVIREGTDPLIAKKIIYDNATVMHIDTETAMLAGKLKNEVRKKNPKFGLVDGMHLATARLNATTFLTLDNDFRGLKNAKVI